MSLDNIATLESLELGPLEEGGFLANKRVLIRVDFNVPLVPAGHPHPGVPAGHPHPGDNGVVITDDSRIREALPTIRFAVEAGAKVVVASHLGRPKGKDAKLSLEPCGSRLAELTGYEVHLPEDCIGDAPKKVIGDLRMATASGLRGVPQVALLENLRFHAGEEEDDETFARALGELCDVYVNDAFGAMHRAHASVHALPRLKKDRGMGFLVQKELVALSRLVDAPERPFVAVLGGAKVSDKIEVIEALMGRVGTLCIGGAMANTFLAAQGHDMKKSLVEHDKLALARTLLGKSDAAGVTILLPIDLVVSDRIDAEAGKVVLAGAVPDGGMALDIGPKTVELFSKALADARTVFWNGPMGMFEQAAFASGTFSIARAMSRAQGFTVVGGGDSAAAVRQAGDDVAAAFAHISTGGGASLELIQGRRLPGIEALRHTALDRER